MKTVKLCLRDAPTENKKLLIPKFEGDEHNVSSEETLRKSNWKSDGEGNAMMENCGITDWTSKSVQQRRTLHDVTVINRETSKGTGKPVRAGGRCLVTVPSRPDQARSRVGPARTCERGGANWYPSQYPTPAGSLGSIDWADCHGESKCWQESARRVVDSKWSGRPEPGPARPRAPVSTPVSGSVPHTCRIVGVRRLG